MYKNHTPNEFRLILCSKDGLKIVEIDRTTKNLDNVLCAMTTALEKCSNL